MVHPAESLKGLKLLDSQQTYPFTSPFTLILLSANVGRVKTIAAKLLNPLAGQ